MCIRDRSRKITPNQSKNTAGIASNLSEDNDPALSINDWAPPKSNAPDKSPILRRSMHQRIEEKKGLPLRD